jgi:hypothetical protein
VSVLHTWGQNLSHHSHIHCVVAGGAWDAQRKAFIEQPLEDRGVSANF